MNRVYKIIWNAVRRTWVVAGELAKTHGKSKSTVSTSSPKPLWRIIAGSLLLIPATLLAGGLPSGGEIRAGDGTISQSGNQMTIVQSSDRLAIDWQQFSIAEGSQVEFIQPGSDSAALNRVLGDQVSTIQGALKANGQVFLVNPNGIVFGDSAQVDVGGLVASTLDISPEDFMAGELTFEGASSNAIINQGNIRAADGGFVAMIAARIINTGDIETPRGDVLMGAGSRVTLDLGGPVKIEVEEALLDTYIEQGGAIKADGGFVYLTAKAAGDLASSVISHSGITEARTLASGENGEIWLIGDMDNGEVTVAGTLDASAPDGGDGGFIETSAASVKVADSASITTQAADGQTGTWLIDPNDYTIAASGGDITGATLATQLDTNNVIIQSADGATDGNGDIFVNDTVSWSANTLTLNADRNIEINSEMTATGTAGLALKYGQGAEASGNTATYSVNAPINLASTGSFSTKLGSDGATVDYIILTSLGAEGSTTGTDLQGINGDLIGNYVLGSDIDASDTSGWNFGEGFDPIGDSGTEFTGRFDGLGHAISDLTINRPSTSYVGLFGYTSGATFRNIGLIDGSVTGNWYVGGLVGYNFTSSTISNAYATGSVTGNWYVGGLVGQNFSSSSISNAYATGSVSGTDYVGGLSGSNRSSSSISNAYATGSVSGSSDVGGLVGVNDSSTVTDSYWNTETSGQSSGIGDDNNGQTVIGLTTAEMLNFANYSGFDSSVWSIKEGQTSAYLSALDRHSVLLSDGEAYLSVSTLDELQAMNSGLSGNYVLFNDIDASDTATWNGGEGFDPIGDSGNYFTGNFDGLGHAISDLTINRPSTNYIGLFGIVSGGSINNIGMIGGSITGKDIVGGLVGQSATFTISNAYVTGSVTGGSHVGGLVGRNTNGTTITNAYATGSVSGSTGLVGGLVGGNNSSTISNAYATGSVTGDRYVGGLVGGNFFSSSISNAYATGSVTGSTDVGGLVGFNDDSATVTDSYWNTETSGQSSGIGVDDNGQTVTGLTTAEMMDSSNFANWDFTGVWDNQNDQSAPYLRSVNPVSLLLSDGAWYTTIDNVDELQAMNSGLSGNYVLFNDIDASVTSDWNSGAGFDPIGDSGTEFTGRFDGLGHTISVLTIDRPSTINVGLFGVTDGATIRNVGMIGGSVTGQYYVGGLVGKNYNSSISNAYATGSVSGSEIVGGLVGGNFFSSSISNAYATGSVTGDRYVGGLMGGNYSSTVRNVYATGGVSGRDWYVGGLVGYSDSSTISNAYATGSVTGGTDVGGLVGFNESSTVTDSYWNTKTSGQSSGIGFDNNGQTVTGLTTAQMQDPFTFIDAGWDFETIWGKSSAGENSGYMMLRGVGVSGALYDDYIALSDTDTSKTYGDVNPSLSGITLDGVGTGNVALAWGSAITTTTDSGSYAYSGANVLDVTTVSANGVYADYGSGSLTIDKAALSVTANDANKTYDGQAFSGGNGVSYAGFVAGEDDGVLGGSLSFGGTAQGAVNAGSYSLTASGLTAANYDISYTDGSLTVVQRLDAPADETINETVTFAAGLTEPTSSTGIEYGTVLESTGSEGDEQKIVVVDGGIRVPGNALNDGGATL